MTGRTNGKNGQLQRTQTPNSYNRRERVSFHEILVSAVADIIKGGRHSVPTGFFCRFGANYMSNRTHVYRGSSDRLGDQFHL
jgi:hypothetical protein